MLLLIIYFFYFVIWWSLCNFTVCKMLFFYRHVTLKYLKRHEEESHRPSLHTEHVAWWEEEEEEEEEEEGGIALAFLSPPGGSGGSPAADRASSRPGSPARWCTGGDCFCNTHSIEWNTTSTMVRLVSWHKHKRSVFIKPLAICSSSSVGHRRETCNASWVIQYRHFCLISLGISTQKTCLDLHLT